MQEHFDPKSGGSFGSSPLRREIGVGQAATIDEIEIRWHPTGKIQVLKDIRPNQFLKITEGIEQAEKIELKRIDWITPNRLCMPTGQEAQLPLQQTEKEIRHER